jgi:hypothetical protein
MEIVTHNVRDIERSARQTLEHLVGKHLSENQQVLIQVLDQEEAAVRSDPPTESSLPDWCNV